jgi:hypothetical protein
MMMSFALRLVTETKGDWVLRLNHLIIQVHDLGVFFGGVTDMKVF